eukprot:1157298-Pelagomonas_calceolata.AAC.19
MHLINWCDAVHACTHTHKHTHFIPLLQSPRSDAGGSVRSRGTHTTSKTARTGTSYLRPPAHAFSNLVTVFTQWPLVSPVLFEVVHTCVPTWLVATGSATNENTGSCAARLVLSAARHTSCGCCFATFSSDQMSGCSYVSAAQEC